MTHGDWKKKNRNSRKNAYDTCHHGDILLLHRRTSRRSMNTIVLLASYREHGIQFAVPFDVPPLSGLERW